VYALLLRFCPLYFIHNEIVLCIVCVLRYRVISERIPEWFVSRGDSRSECREIKRARMPSSYLARMIFRAQMIFTIVLHVPICRTAELLDTRGTADTRFSDISSSRHAAALQRISDSRSFRFVHIFFSSISLDIFSISYLFNFLNTLSDNLYLILYN